ncbi:hypothetical protein [Streptomyces sp. L2]|uniref:DUF7426 family protein n=1 Tax=Streptomyces sp. L2 TaxID=2162665 RepID=UPI001013212D|nr:hypothetical protein [Streptomyces sp. L2]
MAAQFEALGDFLDDYLELPVRCEDGQMRTFRIPSPPAKVGLRVDQITKTAAQVFLGGTDVDTAVLDDDEEKDLFRLVLGPVHDEIAAHLGWTRFRHVALTAMVWILNDRDAAAKFWAGRDPSLLAPNRAARRQRNSQRSESAAANTTRSRGSTSGTKAGGQRRRKPGGKGRG